MKKTTPPRSRLTVGASYSPAPLPHIFFGKKRFFKMGKTLWNAS
jgi:hypothetical protein